jgi:hypothetical protein
MERVGLLKSCSELSPNSATYQPMSALTFHPLKSQAL